MSTTFMVSTAWFLFAVNLIIYAPIAAALWFLYGLVAGVLLVSMAKRWVTAFGVALFVLPLAVVFGILSYTAVMYALDVERSL